MQLGIVHDAEGIDRPMAQGLGDGGPTRHVDRLLDHAGVLAHDGLVLLRRPPEGIEIERVGVALDDDRKVGEPRQVVRAEGALQTGPLREGGEHVMPPKKRARNVLLAVGPHGGDAGRDGDDHREQHREGNARDAGAKLGPEGLEEGDELPGVVIDVQQADLVIVIADGIEGLCVLLLDPQLVPDGGCEDVNAKVLLLLGRWKEEEARR